MIDYDKLALKYAQHRGVNQEVLKDLLAVSGACASSKVLEVGCGTGNYTVAIQSIAGCSCWGVDPSEEMLSRARGQSGAVDFRAGRAEILNFPADTFDLVFSVDAIHHIGDRAAYYRGAYRVLKPGGKVCTVTDSEDIIRNRETLSVYFPETVELELERYPRIGELRRTMKTAGFESVTEGIAQQNAHLTDIQAFREKVFSSLHMIPEEAFYRGIERMARDLCDGPITFVERYLLLWGNKPTTSL